MVIAFSTTTDAGAVPAPLAEVPLMVSESAVINAVVEMGWPVVVVPVIDTALPLIAAVVTMPAPVVEFALMVTLPFVALITPVCAPIAAPVVEVALIKILPPTPLVIIAPLYPLMAAPVDVFKVMAISPAFAVNAETTVSAKPMPTGPAIPLIVIPEPSAPDVTAPFNLIALVMVAFAVVIAPLLVLSNRIEPVVLIAAPAEIVPPDDLATI